MLQDFSKFYIACEYCSKKYGNSGISTGSWGCGAFWCDKAHKFLQQLVSAKCNNIKLSYSTFGDNNYKSKLEKLDRLYEIEIFPEHAIKLLQSLENSAFGEFLKDLDEGYLTLRKVFR